jgi:hypothetical protein
VPLTLAADLSDRPSGAHVGKASQIERRRDDVRISFVDIYHMQGADISEVEVDGRPVLGPAGGCRADADTRRCGYCFSTRHGSTAGARLRQERADQPPPQTAERNHRGIAVRRKTDGQDLERAGVVYMLHKTNAGWQFATVVIHDADDALRPE